MRRAGRAVRQNLPLKVLSLATSILLYAYFQQERNPTVSRSLIASITKINAPTEAETEFEQNQIMANVIGPRQIIDRLKDGDVRAMVDLHGLTGDAVKVVVLPIKASIPSLPDESKADVVIELQKLSVKVTLYPPVTRSMTVRANYPKEPPAGFKYAAPELRPGSVKVSGRADIVNSVDHLVVNASPGDIGARIEGEFAVLPRDKDDNPIDNVTINPTRVRVFVPLVEDLPSKIVPVSPRIDGVVLPPYMISEITATPLQVKIVGRIGRLQQISTMETEVVSVRDLTGNQEFTVNLIIPPDILVKDLADRPITTIKLRLVIQKTASQPSPNRTNPPPKTLE